MYGTCIKPGCAEDAVDVATLWIDHEDGTREGDGREFPLCREHLDQLLHRVLTSGTPPPDTWNWDAA